ncbi:MAG: leucine-rich repeat protein, partial [Actinomycetaceae bacterium]|nr:leucine-rich repeat protein [Actinomycetaceae bacterium]
MVTYNNREYTVTEIGNYAFLSCADVTSVEIPESVHEIGEYAF